MYQVMLSNRFIVEQWVRYGTWVKNLSVQVMLLRTGQKVGQISYGQMSRDPK